MLPTQAADAGLALEMTAEAARQQFTKLAASGLVEAFSQSKGVGRPSQFWMLTQAGHERFPDAHHLVHQQCASHKRAMLDLIRKHTSKIFSDEKLWWK
ncbi:MAG: hypothetical protein RBR82_14445 [Pseudomonas sp.]|nr:hypothetical protein [Pseudomonas sp.]